MSEQFPDDYIAPTCPAELDEAAHAEWDQVIAIRQFKRGERTLLEAYIRSWSKWQAAEAVLAVEGPTIKQPVPRGLFKTVANPLVVIAYRYQRQMLLAARQLRLHGSSATDTELIEAVNPFKALFEVDTLDVAAWEKKYRCNRDAWVGGELDTLPGQQRFARHDDDGD
jgi:phage terminase small subunit